MSTTSSQSMMRSPSTENESSTDNYTKGVQLVVEKSRHPALLWTVFGVCLLIVWGISLLPAVFFLYTFGDDDQNTHSGFSNHTIMPVPHYPCNKPLVMNAANNRCVVPCGWPVYFTKSQDAAQFTLDNISLAISLLGFLFILITWISIKQLRVFPHVIPLYIQGSSSCVSLLIVISNAVGQHKSFCSKGPDKPTNYCVAQGMLIQYFSNVTAMWFVVYSICLVQMVCSKYALHHNRSTRIQHLISAACCCLLPWILVGIVFKEGGYGTILNMRLCLPKDVTGNLTYYTNTVVTEVGQAVGCSCLLFVVFKLYSIRNSELLRGDQAQRRKNRLDKVAIRLVCLMFAYAVITALVYIPICIQLRNKTKVKKKFTDYVVCLMIAPSSSACSKKKDEKLTYAMSNAFIFSYLASALFTISTISFLAFNKQSRRLWCWWWKRLVDCCCLPEESPSADV